MQKSRYEEMLFSKNYTNVAHYVVFFPSTPEVMCSGIAQATHDFLGKKIAELGHLNISADWLTFSLIATDDGGAAVFTWLADHLKSNSVMMTLNGLPEADQPHAIIRFAFEFFENTYLSPDWWDSLEKQVQVQLKERQLRESIGPWGENEHPRPDSCLIDDGVRAVHWTVLSRLTSLPSLQRLGVNQFATRTEVMGEDETELFHNQVADMTSSGECETLEFKETTGTCCEATRSVCAFLNQGGGQVMFGVTWSCAEKMAGGPSHAH